MTRILVTRTTGVVAWSGGHNVFVESLTVGVEEEYQLLDAETGALRQENGAVLERAAYTLGASVHPELLRSQVEISTGVCTSLDQVDAELRELRRRLNEAAATVGCRLGAAATHPTGRWQAQQVTPHDRYEDLISEFQQVARETLIFGCHVHVGVEDPELCIEAMNRVRPWLPPILALSANSPYFAGRDTGHASYRTSVFRRWPMTGMPLAFRDHSEYREVIDSLVNAGMIEDATKIYWDLRPSERFPTLEVRIADVALTVDDAVTTAGLAAAVVRRSVDEARRGEPLRDVRHEVLEAAVWKAARHGTEGDLVDPVTGHPRPAPAAILDMVDGLRPTLRDLGMEDRVETGVHRILADGTGAIRQRRAFAQGGFDAVLELIASQTAGARTS